MKKIGLYAVLIIGLLSCQKEKEQVQATVLDCEITNTIGGSFNLVNLNGYKKTINVRDNGSFVDTLKVIEGAYYATYEKSGVQLYLDENSKVKFFADANDFDNTLRFEGDYADLNNYYADKNRIKQQIQNNFQANYNLSEDAFIKLVDSTKNRMLERFGGVTSLSQKIMAQERNAIDYYAQGLLQDYLTYHPYVTKNDDYEPSETLKKQLVETSYNNVADFFYSQDYNRQLFIGVMRDAGKRTENDTTLTQWGAEMEVLAQLKNDTIRENLLGSFAEMRLALMKEGRKDYYDKYMKISTNGNKQAKVTELFESLLRLEPGNPSPKFVDYENYKGGANSLDDFKGKYVYIDVWATWCGPCKAEIPFLKEIEEDFQDKNIEFVSISVDMRPDHQKWRDMIVEKEMGGVQLFANDAFNSKFITDYQIRGIPQFILLDPEGRIVSAQAPRPSEKENLTTLFNELNL